MANARRDLALPAVVRRLPDVAFYRVSQAQVGGTSFATKRVLGMWVPAASFRRGTMIRFTGHSSTASPVFRLNIGGQASAINLGVGLTWTTGPAAAVGFDLRTTQRTDGILPTLDSSGYFAGATSLVVTTGTAAPFIQPLNFVEVVTTGTFAISGAVLELITPEWNDRPYGEIFDV